jgi:hypothetical protein
MGSGAYNVKIWMKGSKERRERAFAYVKAFINGENISGDADYDAFKQKMEGGWGSDLEDGWGERDSDYFETEAVELDCYGNAYRFGVTFCRESPNVSAHYFFELLWDEMFPDVSFFFESEANYRNNAGDQMAKSVVERLSFNDAKQYTKQHLWLVAGLVDFKKEPGEGNCIDGGEHEELCLDLLAIEPQFARYIVNPSPALAEEIASAKDDDSLSALSAEAKGWIRRIATEGEDVFKKVPPALRTKEFCIAAVKQIGWVLEYMPKKLKTVEVCLAAVKQDPGVFHCVPDELEAQVKKALGDEITSEEEALEAVKNDGEALEYVPEKLKTAELCLEAVKQADWALQYVPEKLKAQVEKAAEAAKKAEAKVKK